MKEAWKTYISLFEEVHKRAVKKGDFVEVFGKAFLEAFTEDTIRAAFRATGIVPFNPNVIKEQQMKPSLLTSTQATFPLPQPSPVRRVMAVFNSRPHTAFDVSPDNHNVVQILAGGSVSIPQTPPIPSGSSVSMPQTPTRAPVAAAPPILDAANDPSLFTPSKRGRIFVGSLASSNSAAFLVGSSKITSSQTIAPPVLETVPQYLKPDWNLAQSPSNLERKTRKQLEDEIRELTNNLRRAHITHQVQERIIEGANAQLIVQDIFAIKLNTALNTKENEKADDRTKLFPGGKGRHLTGEDFIQQKALLMKEKEDEEAARVERQKVRGRKKSQKDALEKLWKIRKEEHEKAVVEWNEECKRLTDGGAKKKDLPKKPTRPLKSNVTKELVNEEDGEENEEDASGTDDGEFSG
jgi:hypothetical protein